MASPAGAVTLWITCHQHRWMCMDIRAPVYGHQDSVGRQRPASALWLQAPQTLVVWRSRWLAGQRPEGLIRQLQSTTCSCFHQAVEQHRAQHPHLYKDLLWYT